MARASPIARNANAAYWSEKAPRASLGVGTITNVRSDPRIASSWLIVACQSRGIRGDEILQARFLDRRLSRVQAIDREAIDIDADDLVPAAGDCRGHARPQLAEAYH